MGDRDRYYDRGEGRYDRGEGRYDRGEGRYERDMSPYRDQRGGREWESLDDYYRTSGRDRTGGYSGPQDYRSYASHGTGSRGSEPWSSSRSFGAYDDQRRYESDWSRSRYEPSGRSGYGGESWRDRDQRSDFSSNYGQSNYGQSNYGQSFGYGAGSRLTGRELGDWNRSVSREPYGLYYYESYGDYGGVRESERGRSQGEESFGQQMRDMGQRVMSKVKRVFRGPKGYKRSDERIREDVNDRLSEQASFDPSEIEVAVSSGEVTLTGSVDSRRSKFLAEEIADDVGGVSEVHNQLRVITRGQAISGTAATETTTSMGSSTSTAGADPSRTRNARAQ